MPAKISQKKLKEVQLRTEAGLKRIHNALSEAMPGDESHLRLATFNIQNLAEYTPTGKRPEEVWHYFAQFIEGADLVAIQEVRSRSALQKIVDILNKDGDRWGMLCPEMALGARANGERQAFLYRKETVEPTGSVGHLIIPPERIGNRYKKVMQPARPPFFAGFKAVNGDLEFLAYNIHAYFGGFKQDHPVRLEEMREILRVLDIRHGDPESSSRNIVLMGDTNIISDKSITYTSMENIGMTTLDALRHVSSGVPGYKPVAFDQIAFLMQKKDQWALQGVQDANRTGIIKPLELVFRAQDKGEYEKEYQAASKKIDYKKKKWFSWGKLGAEWLTDHAFHYTTINTKRPVCQARVWPINPEAESDNEAVEAAEKPVTSLPVQLLKRTKKAATQVVQAIKKVTFPEELRKQDSPASLSLLHSSGSECSSDEEMAEAILPVKQTSKLLIPISDSESEAEVLKPISVVKNVGKKHLAAALVELSSESESESEMVQRAPRNKKYSHRLARRVLSSSEDEGDAMEVDQPKPANFKIPQKKGVSCTWSSAEEEIVVPAKVITQKPQAKAANHDKAPAKGGLACVWSSSEDEVIMPSKAITQDYRRRLRKKRARSPEVPKNEAHQLVKKRR